MNGERTRGHGSSRRNPEWVTFGISVVILGVVVVGLLAQIAAGDDPPQPTVEAGVPRPQADGSFHVPVELRNSGDQAAAQVQVVAELVVRGTTTTGDQTVDFLGAGEAETLVFAFADDPADGQLRVAVSGFLVP